MDSKERGLKDALVLIVDDDPISRFVMSSSIDNICETITVADGQSALNFCAQLKPDLIILDYKMDGATGLEVCTELKASEDFKQIPVMFVTANPSQEIEESCWGAGSCDYIKKPINSCLLQHRVKAHLNTKLNTDAITHRSTHDALTGVYNRAGFEEIIVENARQCTRSQKPLSLIMIDIDWFKRYNDHYGHIAGDACLKRVAHCINESLKRPLDNLFRYGGEEFICVLPETEIKGAHLIAQSILENVRDLKIAHSESREGIITISLGVYEVKPEDLAQAPTDWINRSDSALYQAKNMGRNCIR